MPGYERISNRCRDSLLFLISCQDAEWPCFINDGLQIVHGNRKHGKPDIVRSDFIELKVDDQCFVREIKVLVRLDRREIAQRRDLSLLDLCFDPVRQDLDVITSWFEQVSQGKDFPCVDICRDGPEEGHPMSHLRRVGVVIESSAKNAALIVFDLIAALHLGISLDLDSLLLVNQSLDGLKQGAIDLQLSLLIGKPGQLWIVDGGGRILDRTRHDGDGQTV